jgi:hypothetical protein
MNVEFGSSAGLLDAMHLRAAELWLEVGEPRKALTELQNLTDSAWHSGWTSQVLLDLEVALLTDLSHPAPSENTWSGHSDYCRRAA